MAGRVWNKTKVVDGVSSELHLKRKNAPLSEGCDSCSSSGKCNLGRQSGAVANRKIPGNAKLGRPVAESNDARHPFKYCSEIYHFLIGQR